MSPADSLHSSSDVTFQIQTVQWQMKISDLQTGTSPSKNGFHFIMHRLCYSLKHPASVIPLEMINKADQFTHIHMWLWIWLFYFKLYYPNKEGC